ncbi:MAG: acyltransferase domain-containing protein, partial [Clostridiales bacterium]|nr:acyltransferase domain-containing protein [Clostridiales bacterium]
MQNLDRDIAIVGISISCPAGDSIEEFWHGISTGGDFITDVPEDVIDPVYFGGEPNGIDRFYCKRGGFTKAFKVDPFRFGIMPITANGLEPDQLISMSATEHALTDAGVFEKGIPLQKCSIIIGKGNFSGIVPLRSLEVLRSAQQIVELLKSALPELTEQDIERVKKAYQGKQGRYQPDMAIGTMPNLTASFVANRFDMHGPAYTVDAACASGIVAINHSVILLRSGSCDIAVAGGMHTSQSAMFWGAFDMLGAMSHRQVIAPFSKDADGLLIGQGGGFVVLKRLRKALEDGDRIYALIKDTAVASDGAGSHVTVTTTKGQIRVLEQAWKAAEMDPESIGYIEAHGTATPVGDKVEINTLKEFFGDHTHPRAYVGSVKSNIGHTMPAAGMIGVIKTALALYNRKLPPTLHCEEPLPSMFESRFLPPNELMDWDGEKLPLVAGVNAFGFGGINSHAILTAYEPPETAPRRRKTRPYTGETLRISAKSKEALIKKLETGDYTHTGGDYRIVIFAPDEKRIQQAISIVERDRPWRSRLDIWFTNRPMLTSGGKIVFLFPGLGEEWQAETDTISEEFDLRYIGDLVAEAMCAPSANEQTARRYGTTVLCKEALDKLSVEADMYVGHSLGEWTAAAFAGIAENTIQNTYEMAMIDESTYETYPFVLVSGVDRQRAERWCAEIPGVYLSLDNCPSQILLCGEADAVKSLKERLDEEKVFYADVPFGWGHHTPLMKNGLENISKVFSENFKLGPGRVPVWSASTLAPIPSDKEGYAKLLKMQLTQTVNFRGLIEKLYEEQDARIFIQIGLGAVTGFVEDILKGRDFAAISGSVTEQNGVDRLRRVLAMLFVEGKDVDPDFLGVKQTYRAEHELIVFPRGAPPHILDFPELREAIKERYGAGGPGFGLSGGPDGISGTGPESRDPIMAALGYNTREAVRIQKEMVGRFGRLGGRAAVGAVGATAGLTGAAGNGAMRAALPVGAQKQVPPVGAALPPAFEEELHLTLEDHPYLLDHAIVRQPENWDHHEDLNPVVPFTMTIELLAEVAKKRAPGRKLVKISNLAAYKWILLDSPVTETVKGKWKGPDLLELVFGDYATAEFTFGIETPAPPEAYVGDIDIGANILEVLSAKHYYERYSFHGPKYHSDIEMTKVCARGVQNKAAKQEGKGSLLDIMGQQLGLFLHLTQTENTISFPVRLKEIVFYSDIFDQEGLFEHTMIVTRLTDSIIVGDMVLKRDGKIWSVAKDFVCQRFVNIPVVWGVIILPAYSRLANEIAPGLFHYSSAVGNNLLPMLGKRYLNYADKAESDALVSDGEKRAFLLNRIVMKDAARSLAASPEGADEVSGDEPRAMLYPVEVFCEQNEDGQIRIHGGDGAAREILEGIYVSSVCIENDAAAVVAKGPVGIALEKIHEVTAEFLSEHFTDQERRLLSGMDPSEGPFRLTAAKNAVAKKLG